MKVALIPGRLRLLRKKAKLTQAQLAAELDVDRKTIQRWEGGATLPDVVAFARMTTLYRINFRYMVGITDTPVTVASDGIETELWNRWNRLTSDSQAALVEMSRFLEHSQRKRVVQTNGQTEKNGCGT